EGGYAKTMSKEFIDAEMKLFAEQAREVDIIVTTAMIPGKKSPVLITEEMVKSMKDGSVIVDLAAEGGGNCELSEEGQRTQAHGVTILGYLDLPGRLPTQASQLYGNNLFKLLQLLGKPDDFSINFEDEVLRGATVIKNGEVTWLPPKAAEPSPKPQSAKAEDTVVPPEEKTTPFFMKPGFLLGLTCLALLGLGWKSPDDGIFLHQISVFVLACFLGYMVIWNVTPALHTPLMSVTNAISGIIVIGGMLFISGSNPLLSGIAVLIATINIAGGFLVTQRMLKMFHK
ncbi:MAG: NAD(P)(+) transhydrogenase (Re/Si-specific) subunit alpha, partial [Opitutae bacterium]|nr:NAD(P)(+) transhydrogenase (Re/Si-specific) subunit alpha [Opitutae bacterium]